MPQKDDINSFKEKLHNVDPTIIIYGNYKNSRTKIEVGCSVCGHKWSPLPRDLLSGKGCAMCHHPSFKKSDQQFKADAAARNEHVNVIGEYKSTYEKVLVECVYCGEQWMMSPHSILRGSKRELPPLRLTP